MSGHVMVRIYARTHAVMKALSALDGKSMTEWLDELLEKEANKRGIVLREEVSNTVFSEMPKEIVVPPR